jgi:hypothetical protein
VHPYHLNQTRKITFATSLILILLTCACQRQSDTAIPEEELDVQGTLAAIGHYDTEESAQSESNAAAVIPPTIPDNTPVSRPTITPTVYVPPGQIYFYNFEDVPEGAEMERHPGIIFRKPEYGFEIELSAQQDYFMGTGLVDHPDGNISTYVKSVSNPAETVVMLICRAKVSDGQDDTQQISNAYIASLRLDGTTKLVKRVNSKDIVLKDWQSGTPINSPDLYNNLYLLCDGSRLLFIVNGEVAFDVNDGDLTQGDFGLGVAKPEENQTTIVQFDKIMVYEP